MIWWLQQYNQSIGLKRFLSVPSTQNRKLTANNTRYRTEVQPARVQRKLELTNSKKTTNIQWRQDRNLIQTEASITVSNNNRTLLLIFHKLQACTRDPQSRDSLAQKARPIISTIKAQELTILSQTPMLNSLSTAICRQALNST